MQIQTKIDRIKTEIKFLIEGEGTLQAKQAALSEIAGPYIDNLLEAVAAEMNKPAEVTPE